MPVFQAPDADYIRDEPQGECRPRLAAERSPIEYPVGWYRQTLNNASPSFGYKTVSKCFFTVVRCRPYFSLLPRR
jgi:hypothetical protein